MNFFMAPLFQLILILFSFFPTASIKGEITPVIASVDFDDFNAGVFSILETNQIEIHSRNGDNRILGEGGSIPSTCLYLTGGKDNMVELGLKDTDLTLGYISFRGQRLSHDMPFRFSVEVYADNEWTGILLGDSLFETRQFSKHIYIPVQQMQVNKIRFRCTSPNNGGFLIDDLILLDKTPMQIKAIHARHLNLPVLINKKHNPVQKLIVDVGGEFNAKKLEEIKLNIEFEGGFENIESIQVFSTGSSAEFSTSELFGEINPTDSSVSMPGNKALHHGKNHFWISCEIPNNSDIRSSVYAQIEEVIISEEILPCSYPDADPTSRLGLALRDHSDDGVHTYRIPGLITTNEGTLMAVYDIRRNGSVDLQADIDVGMSRSTDGGQSWEPMKIIMDMWEWGGLSHDENGIGDPSILVDKTTNTIWVAGVWAHGHKDKRNWTESKSGFDPSETSQFMLVKSEDDGITWSEPINITRQIKKGAWTLLLQGPGKGISLNDGTLVFPAQFKNKDGIPYSTIIWSKDHGLSWNIGKGAKSNTTESQVIELDNGSLMLNMRDNRNRSDKSETNGRSIAITTDLGKSWTEHPTSRGVLIEPVCMGSLIKEDFVIDGESRKIVLFSNPDSKYQRNNLTIKFSFDDGNSWPTAYNTLLDEGIGRGYSCMTKIDDQHIGILYESSRADLVFQVMNIEEILLQKKN